MMNVKIDTKDRFSVLHVEEKTLTANMAEQLQGCIVECRQKDVGNIILDLERVSSMDTEIATLILHEQQRSYEMQHSFVICCLQKEMEHWLDKEDMLELMNVTRTESEAWDIVQLEEIEREFMDE
jgi:anti-anti-sigma factor